MIPDNSKKKLEQLRQEAAFRAQLSQQYDKEMSKVPMDKMVPFAQWMDQRNKPMAKGGKVQAKRLYHGTNKEFKSFNVGSYLTDDPDYASKHGNIVMPVHMTASKIKTIPDEHFRLMAGRPSALKPYIDEGYHALSSDAHGDYIILDPSKVKSAITHKAKGGAVEPSQDEMRLALAKGGNVPKTLYHGTGSDIREFRPNTFFSDDPKIAGMYAKSQHRAVEGSGPNIMPVHANLKNPFFFDEADARRQGSSFGKMIAPHASTKNRMSEAIKILKAKGHDGAVLQNFDDIGGRQNQYIVFDPRSVKSAIGNRGTNDPTNPDITMAKGGKVDPKKARYEESERKRLKLGEILPREQRDENLRKMLDSSQIKNKLYHATPADIRSFKPGGHDPRVSGHAVWLSPDPAKTPAAHNIGYYDNPREGVNVMPVHVQAKNPMILDDVDMLKWAQQVYGEGSREFPQLMPKKWRDEVIKDYDSIVLADPYKRGDPHEVIMFHPEKIKSAIGNRGTYDTNVNDINKAEGGTVNAFDYENPKHVSTVAGIASKHRDFNQIPDVAKHLAGALSQGSYKFIEDPRIQSAIKQAGHSGYFISGKEGKQQIVRKAMGGAVTPIDQMRNELANKTRFKGMNSLQSIGANEAPSMGIKAYVPPAGGSNNGQLPIGGVDMNNMQQGQQLTPNAPPSPAGTQPGMDQVPMGDKIPTIDSTTMAPTPNFNPGADGSNQKPPIQSNILQMTPQGQAMSAMKPAGMKSGGNVSIDQMKRELADKDDNELCMTHSHGYGDGGVVSKKGKTPKNTVKAYKLFRVNPRDPGKLFPLFVNADKPVEMNKWVDAEEGEMSGNKVKSKIGDLAYRPGWHAGDLPVATHIGVKDEEQKTEIKRIKALRDKVVAKLGGDKEAKDFAKNKHPFPDWVNAPRLRHPHHVWAEVDMPHDVDWQSEADKRGYNEKGKFIANQAHITDQIPKGGHYRYKTNANMTGNWLIGGGMKVNRILPDEEVESINKQAKAKDLPRAKKFDPSKFGFASGGSATTKGYVKSTPKKPHPEVGTRFTATPQGNLVAPQVFDIMKQEGKGSIVPVPYDATTRDNLVTEVSGHQLTNPLLTEAGFDYAMDPTHVKQNIGGASNLGIAGRVQDRINQAAKEHEGDVYLAPNTMSEKAENFSHHPAHIVLDLMKQRQLNKKTLKALSDDLRSQPEIHPTTKKKIFPYKNFVGFDHPNLGEQVMKGGHGLETTSGNLRKKMMDRLSLVNIQELLDYNLGDLKASILHPDIASDPKGYMGRTLVKAQAGAPLRLSRHKSYDTDYTGTYAGGFGNRPIETVMPDLFEEVEAELKQRPVKKAKTDTEYRNQVIGALEKRKQRVAQPINARVINNAGLYEEGLKNGEFDPKNLESVLAYYKRKGGYKAGGKVKLHADQDTMQLALSKKSKKAK